ncbi:MAG: GGDEF domain-containing protein [Sphingomonadales bacterium]|nr:GGDEF domain-containing protein [Sphingomonadales bacterium]MDE2168191.1 GGDEF domain-containing protein [Sphingomonadales bacterium]
MTGWLLLLLCALASACLGAVASQAATPNPVATGPWNLSHDTCHAVTAIPVSENAPLPPFQCRGQPAGYQRNSLWLRVDLTPLPVDRHNLTLMLHNSRFDRLRVGFTYADGVTRWQSIGTGDFGEHWRAGGQIVFSAPHRDAELQGLVLRFDRLASYNLLRMRLMAGDESSLQATVLAMVVGGALMLLLLGAVYNLSLAVALRLQFPAWQGAWAGCMVIWGAFWSQLDLLVIPAMAGAPSAQICTVLACLAITLATFSAVTALARAHVPLALRRITLALGIGIGLLGLPLGLMREGPIDVWASILGVLTLANLLAVATCLTLAWRKGSMEARAFAGAWAVPMAVLASTQMFDTDRLLWGGGAQLMVLLAAAWQTLWLSVAATHRFARMRLERDRARQAEAQAHELARRDPLTGLPNRRGFMERAQVMLDRAQSGGTALALLLIDVDKFKAINDAHGHEAGDAVLCTLGQRLARWDGDLCAVARFGGEEFAVAVAGVSGQLLLQFADAMREAVGECYHGPTVGRVTVSIGVADMQSGCDVQSLYRRADDALYEAKRRGRDRVVMAPPRPAATPQLHLVHSA